MQEYNDGILNNIDNHTDYKFYRKGHHWDRLSLDQKVDYVGISLSDLAQSETPKDLKLWLGIFPELITSLYEHFQRTLEICGQSISARLIHLHTHISANETKIASSPSGLVSSLNLTEGIIEQWKLYLIFSCATISQSQEIVPKGEATSKLSASELFGVILPVLSSENAAVRDSVIIALGYSNKKIYRLLFESMQPLVISSLNNPKNPLSNISSSVSGSTLSTRETFAAFNTAKAAIPKMRSMSLTQNSKPILNISTATANSFSASLDRCRISLAHVHQNISDFILKDAFMKDESIISLVQRYVIQMYGFLTNDKVQWSWEGQNLRLYFCGFISGFYHHLSQHTQRKLMASGISLSSEEGYFLALQSLQNMNTIAERFISFDMRIELFELIEHWCGHGQFAAQTRDRESRMISQILEQMKDIRNRTKEANRLEADRNGNFVK